MKLWTATLSTLAAALLAASAASAQVPAPVQIPRTPQGTWEWQLTRYADGATVSAHDPTRYTVAFLAEGQLRVRADCNQAAGTYTVAGSRLDLSLGPMTLVACGPDSQDAVFLRDLGQAAAFTFQRDLLVLNMALDSGNMLFSPQPQASLVGGAWRVQSYNNGRGGVVSVLADTDLTLAFESNGRAGGDTGCNTFMGTYTVVGPSLTFGPLAMTRRACTSDAANAQEQAFMAALAATTRHTIEGNRLTLRDADGATQVVLVRAS